MLSRTRKGGQDTAKRFIHFTRQLFHYHVFSQSRLHRRASAVLIAFELAAITVPLLFLPSQAFSEETTSTTPAQLTLAKDATVFAAPVPVIVMRGGDSNATMDARKRALEKARLWQARAANTGVGLRAIDPNLLDDAIEDYLRDNGSPLARNAGDFVEAADRYDFDPRLLVGIAGAESSLGVHIPSGSHNPFGLGPSIHFASFHDAIFTEAEFLHSYFIGRGVSNPHMIGPSYTGTGSQSWGKTVAGVMVDI